jgi:hypothetical protein
MSTELLLIAAEKKSGLLASLGTTKCLLFYQNQFPEDFPV